MSICRAHKRTQPKYSRNASNVLYLHDLFFMCSILMSIVCMSCCFGVINNNNNNNNNNQLRVPTAPQTHESLCCSEAVDIQDDERRLLDISAFH